MKRKQIELEYIFEKTNIISGARVVINDNVSIFIKVGDKKVALSLEGLTSLILQLEELNVQINKNTDGHSPEQYTDINEALLNGTLNIEQNGLATPTNPSLAEELEEILPNLSQSTEPVISRYSHLRESELELESYINTSGVDIKRITKDSAYKWMDNVINAIPLNIFNLFEEAKTRYTDPEDGNYNKIILIKNLRDWMEQEGMTLSLRESKRLVEYWVEEYEKEYNRRNEIPF